MITEEDISKARLAFYEADLAAMAKCQTFEFMLQSYMGMGETKEKIDAARCELWRAIEKAHKLRIEGRDLEREFEVQKHYEGLRKK